MICKLIIARVGLNLNFEFAHEFFMNLNFVFSKSMNLNFFFSKSMHLNFIFSKSMNLNILIKHSTKLDFFDFELTRQSSDLIVVYISTYCKRSIKFIKLTERL